MEYGTSVIELDKKWDLEDFTILTKEYQQLYGFFHTLIQVENGSFSELEFEKMPWLGGASVVNFFGAMGKYVHPHYKPTVKRIQYASPGFIELSLLVEPAKDIAILVGTIASSFTAVAATYRFIHGQYQKRQLTQLKMSELEVSQQHEQIDFVKTSVNEFHRSLNLKRQQAEALDKLSNYDQLVQLKMLLALYRRAKPIAKLQVDKKVNLSQKHNDEK
ncbi:hypothetical protein F9L16_18745 [Agarivorans sp. B2Z047]|uniref:hypothetical protein n=1 Tax=Agarivorans sp. B2Z047 TaxID=2652721 RepID=UPI00128CE3D7|nr:hypothetical protein [Agarivorans sp. B2Z047]MPW31027.1 hypothetical protein [Agarivorans sp. B2Z047]UQN40745.1 hypothetical protein LQZ07_13245 [Agarivorans sp. B2Z047]